MMTRKMITKNMGHRWRADNGKSREKLGIEYRSIRSSINEMFQQMIDEGHLNNRDVMLSSKEKNHKGNERKLLG